MFSLCLVFMITNQDKTRMKISRGWNLEKIPILQLECKKN